MSVAHMFRFKFLLECTISIYGFAKHSKYFVLVWVNNILNTFKCSGICSVIGVFGTSTFVYSCKLYGFK